MFETQQCITWCIVFIINNSQKQLRHLLQVRKMHAMSEVDTLSQKLFQEHFYFLPSELKIDNILLEHICGKLYCPYR